MFVYLQLNKKKAKAEKKTSRFFSFFFSFLSRSQEIAFGQEKRMRQYGAVPVDGGETGCSPSSTVPRSMSVRTGVMVAAAVLGFFSLGLATVVVSLSASIMPATMPQFQYTTTSTIACGCCGAVGCYCTDQCGAAGFGYGALAGMPTGGMPYGGPPMGTQAAVTPDWTDVVTSLTREVSEDTAEIAGLKATVQRLANWQKQSEPRIEYLTHIQKWMREHPFAKPQRNQTPAAAEQEPVAPKPVVEAAAPAEPPPSSP